MNILIHRGAEEIGGNCIELEANGKSILLDLGAPLSGNLSGRESIKPFTKNAEDGDLTWKDLVYKIIEKAPNLNKVLVGFENSIDPTTWTGSRSSIRRTSCRLKKLSAL